jgi:hypothetical protein
MAARRAHPPGGRDTGVNRGGLSPRSRGRGEACTGRTPCPHRVGEHRTPRTPAYDDMACACISILFCIDQSWEWRGGGTPFNDGDPGGRRERSPGHDRSGVMRTRRHAPAAPGEEGQEGARPAVMGLPAPSRPGPAQHCRQAEPVCLAEVGREGERWHGRSCYREGYNMTCTAAEMAGRF